MPTPTGKLSAYLEYLLFQSQQLRCAFLSTWNFPQVNTATLIIWQRFLCESDSLLTILISQFLSQKTHMDFQIRLILQSWAENGEVTHQLTELMIKVCVRVPRTFQVYLKVTAIGEKKRRELL